MYVKFKFFGMVNFNVNFLVAFIVLYYYCTLSKACNNARTFTLRNDLEGYKIKG